MIKQKRKRIVVYFLLLSGCAFNLFPLYLTIITAFKTEKENISNFFALPKSLYLDNFVSVLTQPDYYYAVGNTIIITLLSLMGMVIILPMASYVIARQSNLGYKILYLFLIAGIFIPFQVKMMPLVKQLGDLHMLNIGGICIVYLASSVCEGIFLYTAYIRSIPEELDHAAKIDGANIWQIYTKVIFPLLKPITATVIIKNGLWIWNDFFLPLLLLNKSSKNWTLTLFQYNFKSTYSADYSLIFTTFLLSMLPILILYIFLQKHIIGGLTNGAIKG